MTPNLLKNWSVETLQNGSVIICGEIYNDTKGRFKDGTYIHTSRVLFIDFENRVARTLNSVYHLEEREVDRE